MHVVKPAAIGTVILLSCAAAVAGVNPPSAPAVTASEFTVTWPAPSSYQFSTQLQERVPGGAWIQIASTHSGPGSIDLVRNVGTYEYRTRAVEEFNHNQYEPDIRFVFSTPITVNVLAGEPPVVDPIDVQALYEFEARYGDVNGDSRNDLYIGRLSGDVDNGVIAQTILRQQADGTYVVHAASQAVLDQAALWPVAGVSIAPTDLNADGNVDLFVNDIADGTFSPGALDQMVISSGAPFNRQAATVASWGPAQEMFARDINEWLAQPDYFDNAGEPDKDGYRITIDVVQFICADWFNWGFITCFTYTYEILVGEFSLEDLGLDGFLGAAAHPTVAGSPTQSAASSMTYTVHRAAAPVMSSLGLTSLVGTEAEKQQAMANMTNPSRDPQTLWCVIWCGYEFVWYWDGYDEIYWVDRWEPITIPGNFDDINYSRDAFETSVQINSLLNKAAMDAMEQAAKRKEARDAIVKILVALGVGSVVIEEVLEGLDEIYDEDEGVPDRITRELLGLLISVVCHSVSAQECIERVRDRLIGDGVAVPEGWLEEIFSSNSSIDPEEINTRVFDEDYLAETYPVFKAKLEELKSKPDRWWCTYIMPHSDGREYYGRTSTLVAFGCDAAVRARYLRHISNDRFQGYSPSIADGPGAPGLIGYAAIRGREQQLIDHRLNQFNIPSLRDDRAKQRIGNLIRGVAQLNPFGCAYHLGSNALFGMEIAAYTGLIPPECSE